VIMMNQKKRQKKVLTANSSSSFDLKLLKVSSELLVGASFVLTPTISLQI
jgi:hypothetical protein